MPASRPLALHPRPATPRPYDTFEVVADGLGRYTIEVSLPAGYEHGEGTYPVILATDGNLLFDLVQAEVHGRFAAISPALPPSIVVGVGYPADEGMAGFYARRNFDFHGDWEMTDPLGEALQGIFGMLKAFDWEIMNNEDHHSIAPRAIAAGLRSVHGIRPGVHDEELRRRAAAAMQAMRSGSAN